MEERRLKKDIDRKKWRKSYRGDLIIEKKEIEKEMIRKIEEEVGEDKKMRIGLDFGWGRKKNWDGEWIEMILGSMERSILKIREDEMGKKKESIKDWKGKE